MRNLKRVLSLGLASTMLVGMMATAASAAAIFPDADSIKNEDAVNTLVALGIIKGKDDGNFDPEGIVTRAEMTKMICVALNGGKDPMLTGTCRYPDATNHWAAGYIEYCANLKIVSGDDKGNFNPNNTITGIEASKMILIALGYNAEDEGYVNDAAWDTNIGVDANTKDLYNDVMINPSEGLTRDNAAMMLMNGLDAETVIYDYKLTTNDGDLVSKPVTYDTGDTLLEKKFDMKTKYGVMTGAKYDSKKEEYTYTFDATAVEVVADRATQSTHTSDFSDLYGMNVKVLVNDKGDVYGMFPTDTTVLASGLLGDIKWDDIADGYVTIDDEEIDVTFAGEDTATVWGIFNKKADEYADDFAPTDSFTLIDNTDDGEGNLLVVAPYTTAKVSYKNDSKIIAGTSYTFEDDSIADDIEKDDYVIITAKANTVDGKNVVVKMDKVSGEVESYDEDDDRYEVDGVWYEDASDEGLTVGSEFDMYVVGTYVWYAKQTSEDATLDDVLYVAKADDATNLYGAAAKVYFMNGKSDVVEVTKIDDDDVTAVPTGLYTFTEKDGEYKLKNLAVETNDVGYDVVVGNVAGFVYDDTTIGGHDIADDAVIVVVDKDGVSFVTGADAADWDEDFAATAAETNVVLANEVNGYYEVGVALLTDESVVMPGAKGDETYGYVTSTIVKKVIDDVDTYIYTVWTPDGEMQVSEENDEAKTVAVKGAVISFEDLGDGYVGEVKLNDKSVMGAVTAFNSSKLTVLAADASTTYVLNDDTVYLYVDSEDVVGQETGDIAMADKDENDVYNVNVMVWGEVDGEDTIANLVVVEVNNAWGKLTVEAVDPA